MEHLCLDQGLFDLLLDRLQNDSRPLQLRADRRFRYGHSQHVPEHFSGSCERD